MATNNYFNNFGTNTADQRLIESIIIESIKAYGIDVYYLPRTEINTDTLLGEDRLSQFKDTRIIEMYIKTVDGFEGEGTLISNFGLEVRDQITFTVSRRRFTELNLEGSNRDIEPQSGDLIYFPLSESLFQILHVQGTNTFYQTGSLQTFDLVCELFEYADEKIDTGVDALDKIERDQSYAIEFTMSTGTGTYTVGESVYQGTSLAAASNKGEVASWDSGTSVLKLINLVGTFSTANNIVGDSSTASYGVTSYDAQQQPTDAYANNVGIETVADTIIDFSEGNPFSEGTNF